MKATTREERATFALRGRELASRVRSFSDGLRAARSSAKRFSAPMDYLRREPDALEAAVEEIHAQSEELAVADEELTAQVQELSRMTVALSEERQHYQDLFDGSPDVYLVTDLNGVMRDVNLAAVRRLESPSRFLRGRPLSTVIDAAHVRAIREAILRAPESNVDIDVCLRPRTSPSFWVRLRGAASVDGSRILWTARDREASSSALVPESHHDAAIEALIAERTRELVRKLRDKDDLLERERSLRKTLEQANASKDRFLSLLSQDVRAPLNAIGSWCALLREEMLPRATREHAVVAIERSVRRQSEVLDALLDVSRIVSGGLHLDLRPTALEAVVRGAVDEVMPAAAERNVTLAIGDLDPQTRSAWVLGDEARLRQVIANLLSNGVSASQAKGTVALECSSDDVTVEIRIHDGGDGMTPAMFGRLTDLFRNGADASSQSLGLYVAKNLVEIHGGTLAVEPRSDRASACVVVSLPRKRLTGDERVAPASGERPAPAGRATFAAAAADEPPYADLRGLRALVVEDEPDSRELLVAALERFGMQVAAAADAEAATGVFRVFAPDVLVSDIGLPGTDGYELVRSLRASGDGGARLCALALSGFGSKDDVQAAITAGFDAHLPKPVAIDELAAALTTAVRARP